MNLGYLIDLNRIVTPDALVIPHLSGLHFREMKISELTLSGIRSFRDQVVMKEEYAGRQIDKHIFFIVVRNEKETVDALSACISDIQKDVINFNQAQYEVHVVFNLLDENGITLEEYEKIMSCLTNNAVCVYSWLVDKYEYSGGRPVTDLRRSHAIARLAWMVCNHRHELPLRQLSSNLNPIYNLFGDASIFFNEDERNSAVRNYYYFKSLQHLLNLSDIKLDDYMKEHVLPFRTDPAALEKRIDASSAVFLKDQRVPIEATLITEKTQGLLIKSSEDDNEYLVNAADNNLVFIDDLSRKQRWQMEGINTFVDEYRRRIGSGEQDQETLSEEFLADLQERLIVHNRTVFDAVNNEISRNRRKQVADFKEKVDKHLTIFLNNRGSDNYTCLSEILTPQDVKIRCSNIDKGIAFLEYLEEGKGDYLVDQEVSAGDTSLMRIKVAIDERESRLCQELKAKEKELEQKNKAGEDGEPSQVRGKFVAIDREIDKHKEDIRLYNYQLEHWYDSDSERKLTARSRSTIAFGAGLLASIIWIFPYLKWIRPALKEIYNKTNPNPSSFFKWLSGLFKFLKGFDKFEWTVFSLLLLAGFIVGFVILWKVVKKRKESETQLQKAKEKKKRLVHDCVEDVKNLVDRHYKHLLAFHGKKTLSELLEYVRQKEADLVSFRKTVFRLMLKYRLSIPETAHPMAPDQNTIEINDNDVKRLLFGTESDCRQIPFCFAGGITLSDTFEYFKRKKVRLETTRFNPGFNSSEEFDPVALENEVIPARAEDANSGIQYTPLQKTSILPDTSGVGLEDIHQGQCGDCYFIATLAAIAQMNPEYIISKNGMIQELGEEHKFFRVKFYDKDGNRVCIDVDNKFWNKNDRPIYAQEGKPSGDDDSSYDPWVMAVEKAWAKANNEGYDGIEGASGDGVERERKVEYSYAITGKSAFYCMTQNVPNREKLKEMMCKHVLDDHLPITLYSASSTDSTFANRDSYVVENHAYALKSVNEDGTFDIFNPWNNHEADEDVRGKHFEHVDINFIKDNFDVIVFFGIKESDFSYFERDLTENASEIEVEKEIEKVLCEKFDSIDLSFHSMGELMTEEMMEYTFINASYLFNKTRIKDERGVNLDGHHVICLEPARGCEDANDKMRDFLVGKGQFTVQMVGIRPDLKQNLTILRLSPGFILSSFTTST